MMKILGHIHFMQETIPYKVLVCDMVLSHAVNSIHFSILHGTVYGDHGRLSLTPAKFLWPARGPCENGRRLSVSTQLLAGERDRERDRDISSQLALLPPCHAATVVAILEVNHTGILVMYEAPPIPKGTLIW